jgi:transposase-like protein
VQRYACTRCGKTFSEEQLLDGVRVETAKAAQVANLLVEGVGIRAASRLTGLDQGTVLNILKTDGEHCARLLDAKIQNVHKLKRNAKRGHAKRGQSRMALS